VTRIYLAGAMKHADGNGTAWREYVVDAYDGRDGVEVVDPADLGGSVEAQLTDERVVQRDLDLIDTCDGMLVQWDPTVPTVGTPMEVFYAVRECDIPVVAVVDPDQRERHGLSPWLTHHAAVVPTVEEAVETLRQST
jgi:nucleoside 2-deoxyribosyltransferase